MGNNIIDFYDTDFALTGKTIKITVNKFRINLEEHDAIQDGIYNGPFYLKLNEPIDVERYQVYNIEDINYSEEDQALTIDGTSYVIIDNKMLEEFVDTIGGNLDKCVTNIMNYFINWFTQNLGML